MPAKFVTPGFLKIKVNRNKGYNVLISLHDIAKHFIT